MGKQIHGGFLSMNGTEYDIEIYNDSFGGSSTEVTVTSLDKYFESNDDNILEPLKASRYEFSFLNNSATVDNFIVALANGNEDQFKMVVYKNSNLEWAGVVVIDQVSYEDMPKPRVTSVTAIDGIGRLSYIDFDYASDIGNPSENTFLKYIAEALDYNDLSQYWGASDPYFKESCEYYDTQMTTTGASDSPFLLTRCDRFLFMTEVSGSERDLIGPVPVGGSTKVYDYEPMRADVVIRLILQIMGCRMFLENGSYHIQQVRNFTGTSYIQRTINKSLSVTGNSTYDHRQADGTVLKRQAGCRWAYLPPLQSASVINEPRVSVATSGGGTVDLNWVSTPIVQGISLGTLRGGAGSKKSFRITLNLEDKTTFFTAVPTNVEIDVLLSAGTTRLKSDAATPDIIKWTTVATDEVNRVLTDTFLQWPKGPRKVVIETPEFPLVSQSGCTLDVRYTMTTISTSTPTMVTRIYPIEVEVLQDGITPKEQIFTVVNPNTQNSVRIDYGKILFTDIAELTSKNTIEVYDGTNWVQSGVWDAGYTTDVELSKTMVLETMSLQADAVQVLQGPIFTPKSYGNTESPLFHKSYTYDGDTFFCNGGHLDCNKDVFNGSWVKFQQNKGGLSIEAKEGYEVDDIVDKDIILNENTGGYTKGYVLENKLAALTATATGTITSLSITALATDLKDGDIISVIHPFNLLEKASLTLSADASSGATSLSITSTALSQNLPEGSFVVLKPKNTVQSGRLRGGSVRITNNTTPTPVTLIDGDGSIRVGSDEELYFEINGKLYQTTSTQVT